jgi:hypothetical protein
LLRICINGLTFSYTSSYEFQGPELDPDKTSGSG